MKTRTGKVVTTTILVGTIAIAAMYGVWVLLNAAAASFVATVIAKGLGG